MDSAVIAFGTKSRKRAAAARAVRCSASRRESRASLPSRTPSRAASTTVSSPTTPTCRAPSASRAPG
jgi:hypothetical protein